MKRDSINDTFFDASAGDPRKRMYGWPSAPSLAPHQLSVDDDAIDAEAAQISPERRKKLQRYVQITVAACSALCLLALVRGTLAHFSADEPVASAAAPAPAAVAPAPSVAELPAAAGTASTASPMMVEKKSAKEEREAAQKALERGHA
ncbi:MAG TPA: hypothetical protein VGI39_31530, partial [Polyangiaceae bacterium]